MLEVSLSDFEEAQQKKRDEAEAASAQIAATQNLLKRQSALPARNVKNRTGERISIKGGDKADDDKPVLLTIADCSECRFDVNVSVVKVWLTRLTNCKVRLRQRIVTSTCELTRCNGLALIVNTHCGTVQIDMSSKVTVEFSDDAHFEALWVNRCEEIAVNSPGLHLAAPKSAPVGHKDVAYNGSWLDDQFRIRIKDGELVTNVVAREDGGFITQSKEEEQETLKEVRRVVNEAMEEKKNELAHSPAVGSATISRAASTSAASSIVPPTPPKIVVERVTSAADMDKVDEKSGSGIDMPPAAHRHGAKTKHNDDDNDDSSSSSSSEEKNKNDDLDEQFDLE